MVDPHVKGVTVRVAEVFARRKVKHALIGGLAVSIRGQPRTTKDADFIIQVPALAFPGLLEDMVAIGGQLDVMGTIRRWPVERFTAFPLDGVRIDWMQLILPVYARVLDTAETRLFDDQPLRVATAEGLILTKMRAFRTRDQMDIETLLVANRDAIDLSLIRSEWAPFAATEPDRTAWLEAAIARCT